MTEKEKKDLLQNISSEMTDRELLNIVEGAFEKAVQTSIQPLSLIPASSWDKWDDFVLKNRLTEKFQKLLINNIRHNTSELMVLPSEEGDVSNKVDVIVPVSTGMIFANRGGTTLVKTSHVIAEQQNLLYGAAADTELVSFIKKNGVVMHSHGTITASKDGGYDYPKALADTDGFLPYEGKIIPIVWFTKEWLTIEHRQMLAANKKLGVKILKELIAQLELAGPNLILVGSANNTTTQATATKKAILKKGSRVNVVNESLNKTVQNPIISFNNQPWFKEFWELIESMVNTIIEGLQVGDMNGGGKGTANMHTTEVATSFGVKAQKIINTQNMFLSSWDLFARILRENGVPIPAKVKFTYDSPDNLLVNQMKGTTENTDTAVEKDPADKEDL